MKKIDTSALYLYIYIYIYIYIIYVFGICVLSYYAALNGLYLIYIHDF